nr:glycosyltransferase family A protein [Mammaliicoccus sp. Marseille-Q6498]
MKISVILPVYNVEEYIEECLYSLLNQSIGEDKLEIILVDDCSTDSTPLVINKFKDKFTNLIYYRLDENQGAPGKVRNVGVDLSTGEYLHFVDPDDVLDEFTYETLLNSKNEEDDFVMGKMISFNEDGTQFEHETFKALKMKKTYKSTNLNATPFFAQVKTSVVLKLIRKSFYIENNIHFVENMKNGEDKLVDTLLYTKAKSFSYVPYVIYKYRNRNSAENKSLTHQDVKNSLINDINAYYTSEKYFDEEPLQFFKINVLRSLFWKLFDVEFKDLLYEEQIEILKEIGKITEDANENILNMYFVNELPIIRFLNDKEYDLALNYADLLNERRLYFYKGKDIQRRYYEYNQFMKSKSFKVYSLLKVMKIIK